MNKKVKLIIPRLFSVIISLYFYTLLHEDGHALVAIICGGKVDKFVLGFNAYVRTSGAHFTRISEALFVSMGILTDVQIYNDSGTLVYQNTCEEFFLDGVIELEKGNYVFTLTFMQNHSDMQEHFKSMGYIFEDDVLEVFKEIFSEGNSAENYSVSCSVTIK